jgi:inhibitor of the pro-sigma K processing machinery
VPAIDWNLLLAFAFGLMVLYLLAKILYLPLRIIARLLLNAICGGLILVIFNLVGSLWGYQIGVNLITAMVVGIMGVPGVIMLLILQRITG